MDDDLLREEVKDQATSMYQIDVASFLISTMEEYYYYGEGMFLDFADLEITLASKLTDRDLFAVLMCVNAKENIQKLKLTHCVGIVGNGLKPLARSSVLKQIDLSLVQPFVIPDNSGITGMISEESVLPIINDILHLQGSSFQHLQMPHTWDLEKRSETMKLFLHENKHAINPLSRWCYFGFTCNARVHIENLQNDNKMDRADRCVGCGSQSFSACDHCGEIDCFFPCSMDSHYSKQFRDMAPLDMFTCHGCSMTSCLRCRKKRIAKAENVVCSHSASKPWEEADHIYCRNCRYQFCCNGSLDCKKCKGMVFDRVLEERNLLLMEKNNSQSRSKN